MKKVLKWIFIIVLVIIFAIDVWGLYKYKLKGTNYNLASTNNNNSVEEDSYTEEKSQEQKIEYTELKSTTMKSGEKLFITNIDSEEGTENYTIKGIIYEEYSITKEEYNNLKSGKSSIEIFGNEYKKDKIESNNLKLKSTNEDADIFYIKYDSTSKKYILKDSKTDYTVYKPTENYVSLSVSGDLAFNVEKNGKTNKHTIAKVASTYQNVELPKDNIKINLCTLTFNKKGICTKIVEKDI